MRLSSSLRHGNGLGPLIALALWLVASPAALAEDDWLASVPGSYHGSIWSAGRHMPAVTTFRRDPMGRILGQYAFDEPSGVRERGRLDHCAALRALVLTCLWHDRYGTGRLDLTFTEDFLGFAGRWSAGERAAPVWPWTGRRQLIS